MKITFAGVGSAFAPAGQYQTLAVITSDSGKKLLIDCGSDARFSLPEIGVELGDIDSVYISHLHADHIGGLEWLAFCTFFNPNLHRPKLYMDAELMHRLWECSLRGGLESIEGKQMTLTDYFSCKPISRNFFFTWEDMIFQPVQTVHVMSGYVIVHSYGLLIQAIDEEDTPDENGPVVFFTTDTQFCPHQIQKFYDKATLIFHDCETSPFKSGVHAHYNDLKGLDDRTKAKMWLTHYQPSELVTQAKKDGFAGFAMTGQEFEVEMFDA